MTEARTPCSRCGATLYYHEREQSLCRQCARALDVTRICDRPIPRYNWHLWAALHVELLGDSDAPMPSKASDPFVRLAVRRGLRNAVKLGAPAEVIARFKEWLTP